MRVFLDEGVPVSVGHVFEEFGHEVIYFHDAVKAGSPDELVASAAKANDCILIACDRDMKAFAKKIGVSSSRFRSLSLLSIRLRSKAQCAHRVKEAMSLIEHEWSYSEIKTARRLHVEITDKAISTKR